MAGAVGGSRVLVIGYIAARTGDLRDVVHDLEGGASRCRAPASRLSGQLELGSQVGSHHRPTSGYIGQNEAFDDGGLTGMKP
jgi:hypothetical protein